LYRDAEKVTLISEVILEIESNLLKTNKLHPTETQEEPPCSLLFTFFYLAHHFNFLNQHKLALEYVDKCVQHTPTMLDFEVLRAQIYKKAGNPLLASQHMEEARTYDLADRYLNTKTTRYFLRTDKIKSAEDTITLITRTEDRLPSHKSNILEMQVIWFEYEEGRSWERQKQYGKALKKFFDIEKHFMDFYNDQMDFHTFCLRKMTLRQYIKLLRFEQNIQGHQFYVRALNRIIKIYLQLYLNPYKDQSTLDAEYLATLSESERKKVIRKRKREEARKQNEFEKEKQVTTVTQGKVDDDPDPDGEMLLKEKNPLSMAHKFLQYLLTFSPEKLKTQLLGFEVAMHRKKYLLALKAIIKGLTINPHNPEIHYCIVKFFHTVSSAENLHPQMKMVINIEKETILNGHTLQAHNEQFFSAAQKSHVAGRLAYVRSTILLAPEKKINLSLSNC